MKAEDWTYAGEGGAHAIFSYQPLQQQKDEKDKCLPGLQRGSLLRLVKQEIALCMSKHEAIQTETVPTLVIEHSSPESGDLNNTVVTKELWYLVHIVAPSLHHFVDIPQLALVNPALASGLCRRALDSGRIPPHRQASWQVESADTTPRCAAGQKANQNNETTMVRGLLLRDYRLLQSVPCSSNNPSSILSIEIKPKACYTAVAPLVDYDRRAKYTTCRYQLLHSETTTTTTTTTTQYNPLHLFSHNKNHIHHALNALVQEPRNNFRLWLAHATTTKIVQGNPHELLPQWTTGASTLTLVDLVTQIIYHEDDFMQRIKSLQRLDVIDSDGAVRIYEYLVNYWLDGSHEQAWELLDVQGKGNDDSTTNAPNISTRNLHKRLSACPPALLADLTATSAVLDDYLDIVERLEECLAFPSPVSDNSIQSFHESAILLVERMSRDDCLALLRLWLLSLAMCDLSFFVTMQLVHEEPLKDSPEDLKESFCSRARQSPESPGIVLYRRHDNVIQISYKIKAIDCDKKPAKKLKSRRLKEDAVFSRLSATSSSEASNGK